MPMRDLRLLRVLLQGRADLVPGVPPEEHHHVSVTQPPNSLPPVDPHLPDLLVVIKTKSFEALPCLLTEVHDGDALVPVLASEFLERAVADVAQLLEYSAVRGSLYSAQSPRTIVVEPSEPEGNMVGSGQAGSRNLLPNDPMGYGRSTLGLGQVR